MPDDLDDRFATLMVGLDHPMAIVTTASGEVRSGCLIGFHCQCGIEPPRYAIWLSKANHTYRVGGLCETFAVHFPAADQHELAELFGTQTGDETDKFARTAWTRGVDDVPLLDGCPTRFVGRRVALLDAGPDHVCIILEPVEVEGEADDGGGRLLFGQTHDMQAAHPSSDRQRPTG
jgi:flavin reductase (DIM6/NTAB) family NADH-FMN oxidoreductase RutF